ncbi:Ribonuclease HII [Buchnera aphidicola (Eriosoma grossulariae)]|uniref:ribonuclease HII n=1 Tax=Buchnera aphidicola TaxID=9 RepID=UPI00346494E2
MIQYNFSIKSCLTAGVDEVGCGSLVGNIVSAAVILNNINFINNLKDSKKLSIKERSQISIEIKKKSRCWSLGYVNTEEIERLNVFYARLLAMSRAIQNLTISPDFIFFDGKHIPQVSIPSMAIVRGDNIIPEISAASILAKVERDNEMINLHKHYPEYNFKKNKGYPTKAHLSALSKYGITIFHRFNFSPVKKFL